MNHQWKRILAQLAADGPQTFDQILARLDCHKDHLNNIMQVMRTQGHVRFAEGLWHRVQSDPKGPVTVTMPETKAPVAETIRPNPETIPPKVETKAPKPEPEPVMAKTKKCNTCGEDKSIKADYYKPTDAKCKRCVLARQKELKAGAKPQRGIRVAAQVGARPAPKPKGNGNVGIAELRARLVAKREALDTAIATLDAAIAITETLA